MTYWEQRAADAAARQDAAIARALPELASALQEARRELQKEIEAFWSRYAKNNAVSLADAQKALSLEELADFKGDLKSFRRLAKRSIGTFSLEVENLSVKARITRLEALQAQCGAILQRCYQRQREAIEAAAQGLAVEQYDHALYDIEQYTGFQSSYAQLPARAIHQMLAMPVQGSDLSTALWRQDMDAGFQIRRMLGLMFTTGKPPQDFAEEMQRIIGRRDAEGNLTGKTYEAYRLLYNESAHVSEQAKLAAYEEDGIEELEIVTTLDSKTCGGCGPRDGKRVKVKDAAEGVNIPPFHVNCRCTTAPYVAAAQGSFTRTRAARDPVTGKTVRVKAQTFEEWKKERGGAPLEVLEKQMKSLPESLGDVKQRIEDELSLLPLKHQQLISSAVSQVEISEKDNSAYFPKSKRLRISKNVEPGYVIHEAGHVVAEELGIYDREDFRAILKSNFASATLDDIIFDNTFERPIIRMQSPVLISEYQGRMYEHLGIYDGVTINLQSMRDYFSEGYREYFIHPLNLRKTDPKLFKFIKEMLE